MGHYFNPNVPKNSFHWLVDAANVRSYNGSGSIWYDIIDSNNLTLTEYPNIFISRVYVKFFI